MIALTSHWPLIRERTKPSCGEKERCVSAWRGIESSGTFSTETPSRASAALISRSPSRIASVVRPSEGSSSCAALNRRYAAWGSSLS